MRIQGKFNSAELYAEQIDQASMSQIYTMLNNPCFANSNIAIMPDVHLGKGSVVGFTMTFNNYVNPNVIGVDIGCGVIGYNIGKKDIDLEKFDTFVHKSIPAGSNIHKTLKKEYIEDNPNLLKVIEKVGPKHHAKIMLSIGTLGGGNHFIELDKDESDNVWLIIHSGSRNVGLQVCAYHQKIAQKAIREEYQGAGAYHGMEFLSVDNGGMEYLDDMQTAQSYAEQNRTVMARIIIEEFFKEKFSNCESISSIHNYINFEDKILRKGAISAQKDEMVIIPLNMRDGCIIAKGKGNPDWNFSAPHGAGRLLKRSAAKKQITLEEYRNSMEGIFSSCVNQQTIQESPMAYKDANELLRLVGDTVEIESIIKPIYNFKA